MSTQKSQPDRLVNTIYCEAKCPDEDVFYFGSDDEQYECPAERKRRYELAGQRFLAGSTPRLFSSSLKGPFERSRGWKNPWLSKAKAQPVQITQSPSDKIPTTKSKSPSKARSSVKKTTRSKFDKPECHLPSPQSLKMTSITSEGHPFLEDDELRTVQNWRQNVSAARSASQSVDLPMQDASETTRNSRKRKASHNWLKTSDKRIRTEVVSETTVSANASFNSAPDRLQTSRAVSSTQPTPNTGVQPKATTPVLPATAFPQRESASQLISPPKQTSPRNVVNDAPRNDGPAIELSKEEQAAATLSSPVSLQKVKLEKPTATTSPLKFNARPYSISAASAMSTTSPVARSRQPNMTNSQSISYENDEDFVFNITLDPHSDSESELELEENAVVEAQEPVVADEMGMDCGSSDSELTELSDTPDYDKSSEAGVELGDDLDDAHSSASELTELSHSPEMPEPMAAESDTESEFEHDNENPSVSGMGAASIEAITVGADEVSHERGTTETTESDSDLETALSSQPDEGSEYEEATSAIMELDEPTFSAEEDVRQSTEAPLPEQVAESTNILEPDEPLIEEAVVATPVPETVHVGSQPTESPVQQDTAVEFIAQASPRVKQEAEFSLRAMFKSLVPSNPWSQRTLTPVASQSSSQQLVEVNIEQEQILPSVECRATQGPAITAAEPESEEGSLSDSNSFETVPEEADESRQQSIAEADQDVTVAIAQPLAGNSKSPSPSQQLNVDETITEPATLTKEILPTPALTAAPEVSTEDRATPDHVPAEAPSCDAAPSTPSPVDSAPPATKTPSPAKGASSEPRFAFKSFAAFTTPSPERLRVKKRRAPAGSSLRHPSVAGILSTRTPGSARRTNNRVTWAVLPGEEEAAEGSDHASSALRDGQSSPPPRTPLAELPTSANDKFSKHFSTVVRRTDGLRHRFHVQTEREQLADVYDFNGQAPAQPVLAKGRAADVEMRDAPPAEDVENCERPREATMSVEPMDMVEDLLGEMGDFWQAWDVDAELNAAKRAQKGVEGSLLR